MKQKLLIFVAILIIPVAFFLWINQFNKPSKQIFSIPSPSPTVYSASNQKNILIDDKTLNVEFATTPAEWTRGLSNRNTLKNDSGMIFLFPTSQIQDFWMKDTLIPLDIIWVAENKVVGIRQMFPELGTSSSQLKHYLSPVPVDTVIETNLDWTTTNNIRIGDLVSY